MLCGHHPRKKELYLSSSCSRLIFGQTRRNPPSCFLSEIDEGLLEETLGEDDLSEGN